MRFPNKNPFLTTAIILALAALLGSCKSSSSTSDSKAGEGLDPINKISGGLALRGYDTVAYFQEGQAVKGSQEFTHEWQGAKWHFASAANRDLFARDPQQYAPQYGGYCSWAVSHGYTANGDPEAWKIVEGRLYLNYNQKVKERWEQDVPNLIKKGDGNWPEFLKHKPEHKG